MIMGEKPYKLLLVEKAAFGDTVTIALCNTMELMLQARADGCHAAMMSNDKTMAAFTAMDKLRPYCGTTFGNKWAHQKLMEIQRALFAPFVEAGFTFKVDLADCSAADDFRVHTDALMETGEGRQDFLALLTVTPTTVMFNQMSGRFKPDNILVDGFEVGEGEYIPLTAVTPELDYGLGSFSPLPGTLLFLFNVNGRTLPHSPATLNKGANEQRPRLAVYGAIPR